MFTCKYFYCSVMSPSLDSVNMCSLLSVINLSIAGSVDDGVGVVVGVGVDCGVVLIVGVFVGVGTGPQSLQRFVVYSH